MTEFSRTLIGRSGYDREGFAAVYDRFRPAPPPELIRILTLVAQTTRPKLVVDLGAGTGLSTRAWAAHAEAVVGVEPNARMIAEARRATPEPNVRYVDAYANASGLPDSSADLVTCAQAFHWMESEPILEEAVRVLRPGGVFAAYDYDVPPVVEPEIDDAFMRLIRARREARRRLRIEAGASTWPKQGHLERIRASGCFRFVREIVCHGFDEADAARVVGLAESIGGPRALFESEAAEVDETFEQLRETAHRVLRDGARPMVVCYRIRLGVK